MATPPHPNPHSTSPSPIPSHPRPTSSQPPHHLNPNPTSSSPSPPATSPSPEEDQDQNQDEEEEEDPSIPLTMAASMVLTSLPKDANRALEDVGGGLPGRVTLSFHPISSTPSISPAKVKVDPSKRWSTVHGFLAKKLRSGAGASVFCYVGQVFAPGLDEGVGDVWSCFKAGDELNVHYSVTPAFG